MLLETEEHMNAKDRKFIAEVYEEMREFGFPRKGLGRIYVQHEDDIDKVREIVKELDENEFYYLPDDFVTTVDQYPRLVFVGKFDDMPIEALTAECWKRGVPIWCVCDGAGEA